ncbi:hypothetical protein G9A89_007157 [Geosiphon pyriformis]|nr:hypothetical protein G9A89_007157 [Geosiphon pyriformis]
MEAKPSHQKSKKFLNKIFHSSTTKKSNATVSPSSSPPDNEWKPTFMNMEDDHKRSTPSSPSTLILPVPFSSRSTKSSNSDTDEQPNSPTVGRMNSVQRRYSFSNVHDNGRQRLIAAKKAEYQSKMQAFDELIRRRRGSTLRLVLAPDVASH